MKNLMIPVVLFIILLSTGCSKKNEDTNGTITTQAVTDNFIAGQWQVSFLVRNANTTTSDFAGYKFTFTSNGTVNGANNLLNNPGTWAVSAGANGGVTVNITYTNPPSFVPLTNNWNVVVNTATLIRLSSINGSGGIDQLFFEKI